MGDVLRDALCAIDLCGPLGDAAEHSPVVDFLERLTIDRIAADLAHEHDERCRILCRRVNADGGVRCARAPGDKRYSGAARELADGFRHVRRAAFVAAHDEREPVPYIVERVQNRQKALAGHAERVGCALGDEVGDENLAAGAGRGHGARRRVADPIVPGPERHSI